MNEKTKFKTLLLIMTVSGFILGYTLMDIFKPQQEIYGFGTLYKFFGLTNTEQPDLYVLDVLNGTDDLSETEYNNRYNLDSRNYTK